MHEARRSKVDDFDGGLVGRAQQDVFGLEIAMNNVLLLEKLERVEQLHGDPPHQRQRESEEHTSELQSR